MRAHVRQCWVHTCHSMHVEVRRQVSGVSSLIPHVGSWGLNSGGQVLASRYLYLLNYLVSPCSVFEKGIPIVQTGQELIM